MTAPFVERWFRAHAGGAWSRFVIGTSGIFSQLWARYTFNDVTIVNADALRAHVASGAPMITVANHVSVLDDPVVLTLLGGGTPAPPRATRWTPATREIVFASRARAAWFGAGQCIPIERDLGCPPGGLTQPGLRACAERLMATGAGDHNRSRWVHIFPEGRICQKGLGRAWDGHERDYLRWGVGKVAAWASLPSSPMLRVRESSTAPAPSSTAPVIPPVILPFYHLGMAAALPLDRATNASLRTVPRRTPQLLVKVGEPVAVDDLFEAFENDGGGLAGRRWENDANARERALYGAVAARARGALAALARGCGADALEREHGGYDAAVD